MISGLTINISQNVSRDWDNDWTDPEKTEYIRSWSWILHTDHPCRTPLYSLYIFFFQTDVFSSVDQNVCWKTFIVVSCDHFWIHSWHLVVRQSPRISPTKYFNVIKSHLIIKVFNINGKYFKENVNLSQNILLLRRIYDPINCHTSLWATRHKTAPKHQHHRIRFTSRFLWSGFGGFFVRSPHFFPPPSTKKVSSDQNKWFELWAFIFFFFFFFFSITIILKVS